MSQHGCPERLSNRSKGFQEDGPSQPTMEVLVETLTGTAFEMTVSPSDTIFAIKSKIYRVEGIPVSQQHLLYNLKELEDSSSLCELAIADGARLRLVLGMRGGPISTRRLPPPAPVSAEPWPDIERFIDSHNRIDDIEWSGSGSSGGSGSGSGSGCKVTVLVFRDGERVNMLRVKENHDGTYSPLDINKYTCRVTQTAERGVGTSERGGVGGVAGQAGVVEQNAVTAGKMLELRRRMEGLSLQRGNTAHRADDSTELQKTRSEESLVSPRLGLLDEPDPEAYGRHGDAPEPYPRLQPYAGHEDAIAHMYDTNYTRYEMEMCVGGGYTLVPAGPIEPPPGFPPVPQHAPMPFPPPAPAPAPAPTSARRHTPPQPATNTRRQNVVDAEETSILEECLATEECLRRDSPPRLQPVPATEYGPLVGGSGWRGGGGGGGGGCGGHGAHAHSASALQLRCAAPHAPRPPLEDALFSSSTSDLENLKRNSSRILPALSRHRNRSQLHLSDEGLHLSRREVGSERRQRRIDKIAQLDARLLRFSDSVPAAAVAGADTGAGEGEPAVPAERDNADGKEKKIRIRCGLCKKRLSIATVHRCRCGAPFCAPHRYAEVHGCAYDYKGTPAAPHALPINKPKLPKI